MPSPDSFLFLAKQTRHGCKAPLGENGMSKLIKRLLKKAGINGFSGHDLRRTFATFVTMSSHDEFLAMRLMRDRVPGLGDRYIRYPMDKLVEALEKYSPIRQAKESSQKSDIIDGDRQEFSGAVKPSAVSGAGQSLKTETVETIKEFGGDGGESNSPSKRSCPGLTTSLVSSFVSPDSPQLTELNRTSR
jgi:hypothetical protein